MSMFNSFFKKHTNKKDGSPSKDPVCGMRPTDTITSVFQGLTYKFCSDHCKQQFDADPNQYT